MRWQHGRSRRSRNLHSKNAYKGSGTEKDERAAHAIQDKSTLLQQRPDTFAQTNSVFLIFRLQNGGGPYIFRIAGDTATCRRLRIEIPIRKLTSAAIGAPFKRAIGDPDPEFRHR